MYAPSIRIVGYLGPVLHVLRSHFSRILRLNRMGSSAAAEFLFCRFRRFREIRGFLSDCQSRALLLLPGACSRLASIPFLSFSPNSNIPHRSEMSQFTSFRWSRANIPPTQNSDMCVTLQSSPIHGKYTVHPTSYILLLSIVLVYE